MTEYEYREQLGVTPRHYTGLLSRIREGLTSYGFAPTRYLETPDKDGMLVLEGDFYNVGIHNDGTLRVNGRPKTVGQWKTLTDVVGYARGHYSDTEVERYKVNRRNYGEMPEDRRNQSVWDRYVLNLEKRATGHGFLGNIIGGLVSTGDFILDFIGSLFGL